MSNINKHQQMNIQIIEKTFFLLNPYSTKFASLFLLHLSVNSEIKNLLFQHNIEENKLEIAESLRMIISHLENIECLKSIVKEILEKYEIYDFICTHHQLIGQIWLKTIESCLEDAFTPEVEEAWKDLYSLIIGLILEIEADKSSLKGINSIVKKLKAKAIAKKNSRENYLNQISFPNQESHLQLTASLG